MQKTKAMLWYDIPPKNGKETLEERMQVAARYYQNKYGVAPQVLFMPASEAVEGPLAGMEVIPHAQLTPRHVVVAEKVSDFIGESEKCPKTNMENTSQSTS